MNYKLPLLYTSLISLLPMAQAEEIEEIVVTAELRYTNQLDSVHSVSVVSDHTIASRSAQHLEDLVGAIPNLNFAGGTGRARFFQIRGIGERSQFVDPINPSVGVLVDNIDFSGIGSATTLFDVAQVEVLRGPQGTRYGANALAGLIKVKTRDPSKELTARVRARGAKYDTAGIGVAVSGPAGSSAGYRIVAEKFTSDGHTYNSFLDRDDVNQRDELTLRGKLRIEPTADWQVDLSVMRFDIDNGYDAFSFDNTRTTLSDEPGHDRQQTDVLAIDSTWQLQTYSMQLIASTARSDLEYGYDEDWTYTGIHPWGYTSTDNYIRDRETRSVELRFVSNEAGSFFDNTTDWIAGLYVFDSDEDLHRVYTFLPADFLSSYDFCTTALFLQLDSKITDRFELSSGIRVEQRETHYRDSNDVLFDPNYTMWGGQASLKYQLSNDVMAYFSVARGYKAGGFNTDGTLDPDLREFDSEFLWEFEAGLKGTFLDSHLILRTAIFYDLRRDQQVKSSLVRPRPDGSTEFIDFVGNAAEGTNIGLEIESDWIITDTLSAFANIGILDASFDKFINEFGEDLSGRAQAQAPRYTFNLGLDYISDTWFARVSVDGKDRFYFSDRHAVQSDAYALLNARAGYRSSAGWSVSLWGRNLTDKDYFVRGFGSFGNDPRNGYAVEPYLQLGEPRIVGITLEYEL
jgi:outer membrane receptor protein involved in Fe transport